MAHIAFNGTVTSETGETVTLVVTKPDNTQETFTTTTLADDSYVATKDYSVAGNYSVQASVAASAIYKAWTSDIVNFTIELADRTGTLIVTVT